MMAFTQTCYFKNAFRANASVLTTYSMCKNSPVLEGYFMVEMAGIEPACNRYASDDSTAVESFEAPAGALTTLL